MELTKLAGVGKVRAAEFNEAGILSAEDLINHFPYKYYDFSKTEPFAEDGRVRLIFAMVVENPKIVHARKNLSFVTCKMTDESGHKFTAMWFNQTYIKSQLFLGEEIYLYGKNSPTKKNTFIVTLSKKSEKLKKFGFLPIYKKVGSIAQSTMQSIISDALSKVTITSLIPEQLEKRYGLSALEEAYNLVHQPETEEGIEAGNSRIQIEDMLPLLAVSEFHKKAFRTEKLHKYSDVTLALDEYKKLLPFPLTSCQTNATHEISKDMCSKFSMNRLLQGDVGSGKTAVAFFGCYLAAKSNLQSAFIAPTEILAIQHYENAKKIFSNINITNFNEKIVLLTGSMTKLERQINLEKIASGEALIVIGTHAVFSDAISFKNLSFVVVDEQHRFGVKERKALADKGFHPDILVMSATPIPRSMSLVVYGDLDISQLKTRPHPSKIQTNIVSEPKQDDMWNFIKSKLDSGSKAYVVCARIDDEDDDDSVLAFSAKSMYKALATKFGENVGLVHGGLSKASQEKVLKDFSNGKIKILVSTTIVEVGVDVPDADIMIIATPERFGLATLHQLRGRVGRKGQESFCFCLGNFLTEKSYSRIKFFKDHSDGFEIADFDLKTRGAGDIFGTAQHGAGGQIFNFSSASLGTAMEILEQIKSNINLFARIIEVGEQKYSKFSSKNIILN